MRTCSTCHKEKSLEEFYRYRYKGAYKLFCQCKSCIKEQQKPRKERLSVERARARELRKLESPSLEERRQHKREYNHEYYARTRGTQVEGKRAWRREFPEKEQAHARALRDRYQARTHEQVVSDRNRLRPDGYKKCRGCRKPLPFDSYSPSHIQADGLDQRCRICRLGEAKKSDRVWKSFTVRGLMNCVYCGGEAQAREHVFPKALGGSDSISNQVPSCQPCNSKKSDMNPWEWMRKTFPGQDAKSLLDSWGIDWREWK